MVDKKQLEDVAILNYVCSMIKNKQEEQEEVNPKCP
jgi:hypothetical protein